MEQPLSVQLSHILPVIESDQFESNALFEYIKPLYKIENISLESLYRICLEIGIQALRLDLGIVSQIKKNNYQIIAHTPNIYGVKKNDVYPTENTYCHEVTQQEKTISIANVSETHKCSYSRPYQATGLEHFISTPIKINNKLHGTLHFSGSGEHRNLFTNKEYEFVEFLARAIAKALQQKTVAKHKSKPQHIFENEKFFNQFIRHTSIGMTIHDLNGKWLIANPALCELIGYKEHEIKQRHMKSFFYKDDIFVDDEALKQLLTQKIHSYQFKRRLVHRNGGIIWVLHTVTLIKEEQKSYLVSQFKDISEEKAAQENLKQRSHELEDLTIQLQKQATTDPLTGVHNRRHLSFKLIAEIKRAHRSGCPISLILMDIDFFKEFNDKYGHDQGDEALITMSEVLKKKCRSTDILARYGGEEFVVVLPQTNLKQAVTVANSLREDMKAVKHLNETLTFSAGIHSWHPIDDEPISMEEFLKYADIALYKAKELGRDQVISYTKTKPLISVES